MADQYEYTKVPEEMKEFAKREIGEKPEQVNAQIESLRKWVKSMPHLKCPTDADFLIKFLRAEKFDQESAQRRLDNFCTYRKSPRGCPNFLKLFKADDPIVDKYLNMKFVIPLGKTAAGDNVAIIRFNAYDPDIMSFLVLNNLFYMDLNIVMMDESTQIHGIKFIVDCENMPIKAIEAFGDPNNIRWSYTILQNTYPLPIKSQIFYNEPALFDPIFKMYHFYMNDNNKRLTFRLSQDMRKAEEQIPGLVKILPKEYNGEGPSIEDIAGTWSQMFKGFYMTDNLFTSLSVDESKRAPETCKYLPEYVEYKGPPFKNK